MNTKLIQIIAVMVLALLLGAGYVTAEEKENVTICHFPSDNPSRFHTKVVEGDGAVVEHLLHGDLLGPCADHETTLCDDGDLCTVDVINAQGQCDNSGQVVCGDGIACTDDSCNPTEGCFGTINCADPEDPACDPDTGNCVGEMGDHPLSILLGPTSIWGTSTLVRTECSTDLVNDEIVYTERATDGANSLTDLVVQNVTPESQEGCGADDCATVTYEECPVGGGECFIVVLFCDGTPEDCFGEGDASINDFPFKALVEATGCILNQCVVIPG